MVIFRFFKMLAAAILDFYSFEILRIGRVIRGSKCIIVPDFMTIGETVTEIRQFFDFTHLAPKILAK